jgi:hypothetical protein
MKFKQKPIMVDAIQWDGTNYDELKKFTDGAVKVLYTSPNDAKDIRIGLEVDEDPYSREYSVPIDLKDWIVRDVDGAFYPCKEKIFDLIYEELSIKEKILNRVELKGYEVSLLVDEEVEGISIETTLYSEDTRWQRFIYVVLKVDDRFFIVHYAKGLTEFQENNYEAQVAREVVPVAVTTIDWEAI